MPELGQVESALKEKGITLCERGFDAVVTHVREGGSLEDFCPRVAAHLRHAG